MLSWSNRSECLKHVKTIQPIRVPYTSFLRKRFPNEPSIKVIQQRPSNLFQHDKTQNVSARIPMSPTTSPSATATTPAAFVRRAREARAPVPVDEGVGDGGKPPRRTAVSCLGDEQTFELQAELNWCRSILQKTRFELGDNPFRLYQRSRAHLRITKPAWKFVAWAAISETHFCSSRSY